MVSVQAFQGMQTELETTRAQVLMVTQAHEVLQRAHEALNNAMQLAMNEKTKMVEELEVKLKSLIFRQKVELVDAKDIRPGAFGGERTESFRPWACKLRAFCNAKSTGMRAALEWAEEQKAEINGVQVIQQATGYTFAEQMDPVLHDFSCR